MEQEAVGSLVWETKRETVLAMGGLETQVAAASQAVATKGVGMVSHSVGTGSPALTGSEGEAVEASAKPGHVAKCSQAIEAELVVSDLPRRAQQAWELQAVVGEPAEAAQGRQEAAQDQSKVVQDQQVVHVCVGAAKSPPQVLPSLCCASAAGARLPSVRVCCPGSPV